MVNDKSFISWPAQKLNHQKCRLEQVLKAYLQSQKSKSRRSLPDNTQQKIYEFCLLPENSIMSTNRRSGRDEIRISTLKYLKDHKHFELINDKNLTEKEVVLRKRGTIKKYICGRRMVYTKPIRKIFQSFTEKEGKCGSLSTFLKYKPFCITNPTESEKESCLCKRCLNADLLFSGINIFCKTTKLTPLFR